MIDKKTEEIRAQNTIVVGRLVSSELAEMNAEIKHSEIPFQLFQALQKKLPDLGDFDLGVYPPSLECFSKYIVYSHNKPGVPPFSLTLMVFSPGQSTPKHSHKVDCAPICLQGVIHEVRYIEEPDPSTGHCKLREFGVSSYKPYEGGYLYKENPNIHTLENRSSSLAISLHLYMFDTKNLGDVSGMCDSANSVLKVYP